MLRITLAFPERGLKSDPVALYLGHDADAAAQAIKSAPAKCVVARTYILGQHHKQVDLESQRAANATLLSVDPVQEQTVDLESQRAANATAAASEKPKAPKKSPSPAKAK